MGYIFFFLSRKGKYQLLDAIKYSFPLKTQHPRNLIAPSSHSDLARKTVTTSHQLLHTHTGTRSPPLLTSSSPTSTHAQAPLSPDTLSSPQNPCSAIPTLNFHFSSYPRSRGLPLDINFSAPCVGLQGTEILIPGLCSTACM